MENIHSTKGWWRLLEVCDVTNKDRPLICHFRFYQELKIRLKPREMVIFLCLKCKITHK